jgi:hypothetical protein
MSTTIKWELHSRSALHSPKAFKKNYISSYFTLMCSLLNFKISSKMHVGVFPFVFHLCLLTMLLHQSSIIVICDPTLSTSKLGWNLFTQPVRSPHSSVRKSTYFFYTPYLFICFYTPHLLYLTLVSHQNSLTSVFHTSIDYVDSLNTSFWLWYLIKSVFSFSLALLYNCKI